MAQIPYKAASIIGPTPEPTAASPGTVHPKRLQGMPITRSTDNDYTNDNGESKTTLPTSTIASATQQTPRIPPVLELLSLEACHRIITTRYYPSHCTIRAVERQGGCSFTCTVRVGGEEEVVVQFRPVAHRVSWMLVREARVVYGDLIPVPLWIDEHVVVVVDGEFGGPGVAVQVFGMSVVGGVGFARVMPARRALSVGEVTGLRGLLEGMARFFGVGWRAGLRGKRRLDGTVGSSMVERLRLLASGLPGDGLRAKAKVLLGDMERGDLDVLPLVLTHGDLLPSNVLVDPQSWMLRGLVDWAEAEHLPFGMALYGIEHMLGYLEEDHFRYYGVAKQLRTFFWRKLMLEIPALRNPVLSRAVFLARGVGMMLWHGVAWNGGKLDRPIDKDEDRGELAYLESFLDTVKLGGMSKI